MTLEEQFQLSKERLQSMGIDVNTDDPLEVLQLMDRALANLNNDLKQKQQSLLYLADIHAANLSIAEKKSTSKSERIRLVGIVSKVHNILQGCGDVPNYYDRSTKKEDVLERIESGIDYLIKDNPLKPEEQNTRILKPIKNKE